MIDIVSVQETKINKAKQHSHKVTAKEKRDGSSQN